MIKKTNQALGRCFEGRPATPRPHSNLNASLQLLRTLSGELQLTAGSIPIHKLNQDAYELNLIRTLSTTVLWFTSMYAMASERQ